MVKRHAALARELDRVAQQIVDDARQLDAIGRITSDSGGVVADKFDALVLGLLRELAALFAEQIAQRKFALRKLDPGLNRIASDPARR